MPPGEAAFLGSLGSGRSVLCSLPIASQGCPLPGLDGAYQRPAVRTLLRPRSLYISDLWYRNLHRLSIAYAVRPRLRSRLTLSGRALLRNP